MLQHLKLGNCRWIQAPVLQAKVCKSARDYQQLEQNVLHQRPNTRVCEHECMLAVQLHTR